MNVIEFPKHPADHATAVVLTTLAGSPSMTRFILLGARWRMSSHVCLSKIRNAISRSHSG